MPTNTLTSINLTPGAASLGVPSFNPPVVISDYALDNGMTVFPTLCDRIYVCTGPITTFASVISTAVGVNIFGAGNAFGGINNGSPSGRTVTSIAFTNGNITSSGLAICWAAVSFANSQLLAWGVLSGDAQVTQGQLFGLPSFVIHEQSYFGGANILIQCEPAVPIATAAAGLPKIPLITPLLTANSLAVGGAGMGTPVLGRLQSLTAFSFQPIHADAMGTPVFQKTGLYALVATPLTSGAAGIDKPPVGKYYFVSNSGLDTANGLNSSTPWATVTKVNATTFNPGDVVSFNGGQTFTDAALTPASSGSSLGQIIFTSYGIGRAVMTHSLYIADKDYLTINGINFPSFDLSANTAVHTSITLQNLAVTGGTGNYIGGDTGTAGWSNILVQNFAISNQTGDGLGIYGSGGVGVKVHSNITVRNGTISGCSLNGCYFGNVSGGLLNNVVASTCGTNGTGGPVGLWTYESDSVTIQFCESYNNTAPVGVVDGDGFDIDEGSTNCVIEYCYSHGNWGAGFLCWNAGSVAWNNNTIRYCIGENNGNNPNDTYGEVTTGGITSGSVAIYNNTFFNNLAGGRSLFTLLSSGMSGQIANNIFYSANNTQFIYNPSSSNALFAGNDYYTASGTSSISWAGATYTSIASWQTATGQEKINGVSVALTSNPLLVSPGGGGTVGGYNPLDPAAYELNSGSPLIGTGVNLASQFGINSGLQDFYGNPTQAGYYSVGAFGGPGISNNVVIDLNFLTGVYYPGIPSLELSDIRASSKFITDASGNLTSIAANTLPLNGTGLLIERQATNLQTHSLYDTLNITSNVTATSNAAAGPDGSITAFSLLDNATNATHYVALAQPSFVVGKNYTFSKYYKANTASLVQMTTFNVAFGSGYADFSLSGAGSVTQSSGLTSSGITGYSNGWYRCWITIMATANAQDTCIDVLINSSTATRSPAYAGTGTGVYVWNSQAEYSIQSNLPSSPIITTTVAATRAADFVVVPPGVGYFILTFSDGTTKIIEAEEDFTENSIMTGAASFSKPALAVNNNPLVNSTGFTLGLPATINESVGTMTGTNSPTSWSIVGGNPSGYFAINNSGQISVTSAGAFALSMPNVTVDGFAKSALINIAATTCQFKFSTTNPNDVVVIGVFYNGPTGTQVNTITGGGLTFVQRAGGSNLGVGIEEWWAIAPTILNAVTLTVTLNQSTSGAAEGPYIEAMAIGISGMNTSSPFDTYTGLPILNNNFPADPVSIYTSYISTEMILGIFRATTPTAGTGFTSVVVGSSGNSIIEYDIVSAPQTGLRVGLTNGGGSSNGSIVDAIVGAATYTLTVQANNSSGSEVGTAAVTVQQRAGYSSLNARPLTSGAAGIGQAAMITLIFDLNFPTAVYFPAPPASELTDIRASTKFLTDGSGNLTSIGANVLPFNSTGLLIERQATNLQTHSLYDVLGTSNNVATIINAAAGPNGTTTALSLVDNATNASHYVTLAQPSFVIAKNYTFSKYYKANTASMVQMTTLGTAFGAGYANFSLSGSGSVTQSSGLGSGLLSSGITGYSNGWYRCWITLMATASTSDTCLDALINSTTATRLPAYAGTGTGIYVWNSQAELSIKSNLPSSPIITTNVTSTRAADFITVPLGVGYFILTFSDASTQMVEAEEDFTENSITTSAAGFDKPALFANNSPLVIGSSFRLGLPAISNESVGTITATNSPTSWSIVGGNALGYFAINNSGQITVTPAGATAAGSGLVMPNLIIDGTAAPTYINSATTTAQIKLTTTQPNDIIVISPVYNGPAGTYVSSITGGGLTFAHRATGGDTAAGGSSGIEEWWAVAPTALNAVTFTVTFNQSTAGAPEGPYVQLMAIGIAGANTTAPFDTNSSLPIQLISNLATDPVSINTSYTSREMILGMFRAVSPTSGANFTTAITGFNTIIEYDVVNNAQTGLNVGLTTGAGSSNGCVVDAIVSASTYPLTVQAVNSIGSGIGTASVVLYITSSYTANSIASGAAGLGVPILFYSSKSIASGAAGLGTPALTTKYILAATNLASGAAGLGRPVLGSTQQTINVGATSIFTTTDSGNANLLIAQPITLTQQATIESLSFYVGTAAGSLILGIYNDNGTGTYPGTLVTQTASFTPVTGWNTQSVLSAQQIPAGIYWLAYLPNNNGLIFRHSGTAGIANAEYYTFTFGTMPSTFATGASSVADTWNLYGTFVLGPPVLTATSLASAHASVPTVPLNGRLGLVATNLATASSPAAIGLLNAGTLPNGVTLQAIDGEIMTSSTTMSNNYYASSNRGHPSFTVAVALGWDSPDFFPIGPFLADYNTSTSTVNPSLTHAQVYADVGWNMMWDYNSCDFTTAASNGLSVMAQCNGGAYSGTTNAQIVGLNNMDEPNAWSQVTSPFTGTADSIQDTRFFNVNFTWTWPSGTAGNITGSPSSSPAVCLSTTYNSPTGIARKIDQQSIDIYWMTLTNWGYGLGSTGAGGVIYNINMTADQGARGSNYGDMVDKMRQFSSAIPIVICIEDGNPFAANSLADLITPEQFHWACWGMVIHGGLGIDVFDHSTSGSLGDANVLCDDPGTTMSEIRPGESISMYNQMKYTQNLIHNLARIIKSPFALNYATVSPAGYLYPTPHVIIQDAGNIDISTHWYHGGPYTPSTGPLSGITLNNGFYIMSCTRCSGTTTNLPATFTIVNTGQTTVTVIGESRTIGITGGTTFTDTFAKGSTVHIYYISG